MSGWEWQKKPQTISVLKWNFFSWTLDGKKDNCFDFMTGYCHIVHCQICSPSLIFSGIILKGENLKKKLKSPLITGVSHVTAGTWPRKCPQSGSWMQPMMSKRMWSCASLPLLSSNEINAREVGWKKRWSVTLNLAPNWPPNVYKWSLISLALIGHPRKHLFAPLYLVWLRWLITITNFLWPSEIFAWIGLWLDKWLEIMKNNLFFPIILPSQWNKRILGRTSALW